MANENAEALHDVGHDKAQKVGEKFVNPGTPEAPLASRESMTQATIRGNGSEILKNNLIK